MRIIMAKSDAALAPVPDKSVVFAVVDMVTSFALVVAKDVLLASFTVVIFSPSPEPLVTVTVVLDEAPVIIAGLVAMVLVAVVLVAMVLVADPSVMPVLLAISRTISRTIAMPVLLAVVLMFPVVVVLVAVVLLAAVVAGAVAVVAFLQTYLLAENMSPGMVVPRLSTLKCKLLLLVLTVHPISLAAP